jgi:glutathione S-transferase
MKMTPEPLTLIGQYDSPFVRRVAVALRRYGLAYQHRPWSVWSDAEELARVNPLRRVPVLLLGDGTALVESGAILDLLDELAGAERALIPRAGGARRDALRICALATGLADKAVSLFYEPLLRAEPSETWSARCRRQIADTLDALEADRAPRATPYWFGEALGHADIAAACALRFAREAHPGLFDERRWPALAAHAARCEALDDFRAVAQPIVVKLPAPEPGPV